MHLNNFYFDDVPLVYLQMLTHVTDVLLLVYLQMLKQSTMMSNHWCIANVYTYHCCSVTGVFANT